jgi:hypothetical protein
MARLGELARLIRSKNAGPFLLTFDIMFDDAAVYEAVRRTGVISTKLVSTLYGVPEDQVRIVEYDPGLAFKATIPRVIPSGDPLDGDIYGAQQHAPLVDLEIPLDL